jgi:hypothetical protein
MTTERDDVFRMARRAVFVVSLVILAGCTGKHVSPLTPPPYRTQMAAPYGEIWTAIVKALARQNIPLRAIARDSGVIASDEFVTPIGVYADCGSLGGDRVEGEALVSYTLFVTPNGEGTRIQINSKMRTFGHRKGSYLCVSTLRFEANLAETIQELVKE